MEAEHVAAQRFSKSTIALALLASTPLLVSLGAHSAFPKPTPPTVGEPRPSLVFAWHMVDVGDEHLGAKVEAKFAFKNCGREPVTNIQLKPSCGCLKPRIDKEVVLPGEEGLCRLSALTTREAPGPHEYSLAVSYNDPKPQTAELVFRLIAPKRHVRVVPHQLIVYQSGNEETAQQLHVIDTRAKPLRVLGIEPSSSSLRGVVVDEVDNQEEGERRTTIHVTVAAKVAEKGEDAYLRVKTDDAEFPWISIPVHIRKMRFTTKVEERFAAKTRAGTGTPSETESQIDKRPDGAEPMRMPLDAHVPTSTE